MGGFSILRGESMPATSKAIRGFMCLAIAVKEGRKKESEVSKEVVNASHSMTVQQLKDY